MQFSPFVVLFALQYMFDSFYEAKLIRFLVSNFR